MSWLVWSLLVSVWLTGWVLYCKRLQRDVAKKLETMDPRTEFNRMVMLLCGHELPLEFFLGINLAFYRTFVSPTISGRYHATRAIEHHTLKRVDDTDLLMHAWCDYGTDSEVAEASFKQVNRIHGNFDISNKDFVFILCCFVVDTLRMSELTGRRQMTPNEKQAHFNFWMDVGKRMNLVDLPKTLQESFEIVKNYVESDDDSRVTNGGQALTEAVTKMNIDLYPFLPESLIRKGTQILLYEVGGPIFYRKLGYETLPTRFEIKCFETLCALRRVFLRTFTCPRSNQHRLSEELLRKNYDLPVDTEVFQHVGPEYLMGKLRRLYQADAETASAKTMEQRQVESPRLRQKNVEMR